MRETSFDGYISRANGGRGAFYYKRTRRLKPKPKPKVCDRCRFLYGEDYESCTDEISEPEPFVESKPKPKPKICNRCEFLYGEDYESCDH